MKWISVLDKLPEEAKDVLFFDSSSGMLVGYVYQKRWCAFNWFDDFLNVTHWMPLPEPPKENL